MGKDSKTFESLSIFSFFVMYLLIYCENNKKFLAKLFNFQKLQFIMCGGPPKFGALKRPTGTPGRSSSVLFDLVSINYCVNSHAETTLLSFLTVCRSCTLYASFSILPTRCVRPSSSPCHFYDAIKHTYNCERRLRYN